MFVNLEWHYEIHLYRERGEGGVLIKNCPWNIYKKKKKNCPWHQLRFKNFKIKNKKRLYVTEKEN